MTIRIVPALLSAALVVFGFGFVTVARAGTAEESVPQRQVSYADLNLDRPSDVATLYSRIGHAAREVCHDQMGPFAQPRCVSRSVAEAVASVRSPTLTALHAAHTQPRAPVTARR